MIKKFKKYVDTYNFDFKVDSELELINLKKSIDDTKISKDDDEGKIKTIIRQNKLNKLTKRIDRYIKEEKETYFFKEKNIDWIVNGVFKEYCKTMLDNPESVQTGLYVDVEYEKAVNILLDKEKYNSILGK